MYSDISHEVGTYPEGNKGGLAIVPPSKICTAKNDNQLIDMDTSRIKINVY